MRQKLPADQLVSLSHVSDGLLREQVDSQRARYGANDIITPVSSSWRALLRDTLRDPMVWFLAITSLLFVVVGDYVEAGVLGIALLPILGMDAFLHRRTQLSTMALAQRLSSSATVLRDGQVQQIKSVDLVPGDIAILKANEFVPADAVLVSDQALQVDESALTGEALPIKKSPVNHLPAASSDRPIDAEHWMYAGTRLLTGTAKVLIAYTGKATQYGEIVRLAQSSSHDRTPLQQAMMSLTKQLLFVALVFCVVLGITRLIQGHGWVDAVISAVTLAIAALPEEFPVVFAFFLGVGVYRLAQQQALVRRAVVVENIGRVTTICTDKTGTLTEGRLVLGHKALADQINEVRLMQAATLASRQESQDPLDQALLAAASRPDFRVIATFPFSEDRRRETAVVRLADQRLMACVKGAPETVLQMCSLQPAQREAWVEKANEFALTGHKVIGFADRLIDSADWQETEPQEGYVFLGLIAFEDPIREAAKQAVQAAQTAGIRVIMVTGDHAATAACIAREIGLGTSSEPRVVQGEAFNERDLKGIDVLARATPAQKLQLVQLLHAQGEIVAVTGDGVNDAPALKGADIGIAMGEHGTQAAREVASIVLLDDNFRTIVRAIAEGRQLFANLQLSFAYLLMVHLPLVATAAWIPLAGYPLLYLPIHIVWLELIIHPTALLGFQARAKALDLAPVNRTATTKGFFDWRQWGLIAVVGLLVCALIVVTYERSLSDTTDVEHARTMGVALLICSSVAIALGLSECRTRASMAISLMVVMVSLVFIQWQPIASLLHLKPLHLDDGLILLVTSVAVGLLALAFTRLVPRRA